MEIYGRLTVNSFALRVDNKGEEENIGTGVGVGEGSDNRVNSIDQIQVVSYSLPVRLMIGQGFLDTL